MASEIGISEAARRSGFTREQIIYLDERGHLGTVERVRDARRFSEAQVERLERMGALRRLGLRIDEAVSVASSVEVNAAIDLPRLCAVANAKAAEIEQAVRAWLFLCSLIGRYVAPGASGGGGSSGSGSPHSPVLAAIMWF